MCASFSHISNVDMTPPGILCRSVRNTSVTRTLPHFFTTAMWNMYAVGEMVYVCANSGLKAARIALGNGSLLTAYPGVASGNGWGIVATSTLVFTSGNGYASADLRAYHVENATEAAVMTGHTLWIRRVTVDRGRLPDGWGWVWSASRDGTVRRWVQHNGTQAGWWTVPDALLSIVVVDGWVFVGGQGGGQAYQFPGGVGGQGEWRWLLRSPLLGASRRGWLWRLPLKCPLFWICFLSEAFLFCAPVSPVVCLVFAA